MVTRDLIRIPYRVPEGPFPDTVHSPDYSLLTLIFQLPLAVSLFSKCAGTTCLSMRRTIEIWREETPAGVKESGVVDSESELCHYLSW